MTSISSSHKSRASGKRKAPKGQGSEVAHKLIIDGSSNAHRPAFPLVAFLWPARTVHSQWLILPLVLMVVGLFRWAVGIWGYSGYQAPPMHGDFEAQRHWMEITTHLPISQWYFHDLEWWGLDYPPLTAYHSWVMGKIGSVIDPTWFALYASRGLEHPVLKVYMRATVIISEYLTYIPAIILFLRRFTRIESVPRWEASIALVAILMQPALMLIDHAHFQYNAVMLGLFLASISSLVASRFLWSCVFFVAALGYKQMALYYAPAIFAHLLGACLFPRTDVIRFLGVAMVTLASFAILFAPIIFGGFYDARRGIDPFNGTQASAIPSNSPSPILTAVVSDSSTWYYPAVQQLTQAMHRIFPFARGLFEDKVANFWCALNVLFKLKKYPIPLLQQLSLLATLVTITPPCGILLLYRNHEVLLPSLAATAWGFFLFSFQVHEKSVLLPLLPMTLLLASKKGLAPSIRAWVGWANMLGVWTMFPLLKRAELRVPYFVLSLLWAYLLGLPPTSFSLYTATTKGDINLATKALHGGVYGMMVLWHVGEHFIRPPKDKPDIWTIINVGIGAAGFGVCYVWCMWQSLEATKAERHRKRKIT